MADIIVTPATGEIAIDLRTTFPATLAIEPATIDVALEPVGPAGPRGVQGATAFGWADYSDNDAPTPIELDEGVRTRLDRNLAPTTANNKLVDVFAGHLFWTGASPNKVIAARAVGDVIAASDQRRHGRCRHRRARLRVGRLDKGAGARRRGVAEGDPMQNLPKQQDGASDALERTLAHHDAAIINIASRVTSLEGSITTMAKDQAAGFQALRDSMAHLTATPRIDPHKTVSTVLHLAVLFSMVVGGIIWVTTSQFAPLVARVQQNETNINRLSDTQKWVPSVTTAPLPATVTPAKSRGAH